MTIRTGLELPVNHAVCQITVSRANRAIVETKTTSSRRQASNGPLSAKLRMFFWGVFSPNKKLIFARISFNLLGEMFRNVALSNHLDFFN